jgi:hypothetical protein
VSGIWKIVHRKSTNTVNDKIIKDDGGW